MNKDQTPDDPSGSLRKDAIPSPNKAGPSENQPQAASEQADPTLTGLQSRGMPSQGLADWGIPATKELLEQMNDLADRQPALLFTLNALESGTFRDRHGRSDPLGSIRNPVEQIALLAWLARHCITELSIEIGFGMGMTANTILSGRIDAERPFRHFIYDPYGLPDQRGELVQVFLRETHGDAFQRIFSRSQFGIAELANAPDPPPCGLVYVDGDHQFEGVLADFFAADKLMPIGGFMVFDDASFPPVETVIHYVRNNRDDYEVSNLEIPNTAVLRRIDVDRREWDHFRPFEVVGRGDWIPTDRKPSMK
ncbi:MAG: class I SAM-dependent methyltransferase [Rubripirellula sp.]